MMPFCYRQHFFLPLTAGQLFLHSPLWFCIRNDLEFVIDATGLAIEQSCFSFVFGVFSCRLIQLKPFGSEKYIAAVLLAGQ